jgi:alpha-ketoglutarate-dependent taurine dioxygenase
MRTQPNNSSHSGDGSMATLTNSITVTRTTPAVGGLVEGVDLSKPLDKETVDELRRAWLDRGVLFFRNQDLDDQQLEDFIGHFGTPIAEPSAGSYGGDAKRRPVHGGDTSRTKGVPERWHADATWIEQPPAATVLRMVQPPAPGGGDTLWANVGKAYEDLIEPLRTMLDKLTAVHWMYPSLAAMNMKGATNNEVEWIHPVVSVHPETGRKSLFVNEAWTRAIAELPTDQSVHILAMIYSHIRSPHYSVRWRWAAGDVALWDNRAVQHFAVPDYDAPRIIQRAVIAGWKPQGPAST